MGMEYTSFCLIKLRMIIVKENRCLWMSIKLGKWNRCTSVTSKQLNLQHATLDIEVQYSTRHSRYHMFIYSVCLLSKPEISWSLLTRHTLFSDSYFFYWQE